MGYFSSVDAQYPQVRRLEPIKRIWINTITTYADGEEFEETLYLSTDSLTVQRMKAQGYREDGLDDLWVWYDARNVKHTAPIDKIMQVK